MWPISGDGFRRPLSHRRAAMAWGPASRIVVRLILVGAVPVFLRAAPSANPRVPAPPMPPVLPVTPGTAPGAAGASGLPHGLRGLVDIPDPYAWVRSAAGVVGLIALCAFGFWLWWRRRSLAPSGPEIRPDDVARARLQRALERIGEPDAFVAEVSAAVRTYLEARFGLRAPERTTEEFVEELRANGALATEHRDALGSFLGACDLVKFAGVRPGQVELEELHLAALKLVNELNPAPPPVASAEAGPPRLEEGTYA